MQIVSKKTPKTNKDSEFSNVVDPVLWTKDKKPL